LTRTSSSRQLISLSKDVAKCERSSGILGTSALNWSVFGLFSQPFSMAHRN
jgi:hypothetical protein